MTCEREHWTRLGSGSPFTAKQCPTGEAKILPSTREKSAATLLFTQTLILDFVDF